MPNFLPSIASLQLFLACCLASMVAAEVAPISFTLTADQPGAPGAPIKVPLNVPQGWLGQTAWISAGEKFGCFAQVCRPSLLARVEPAPDGQVPAEVVFLLPQEFGQPTIKLTVDCPAKTAAPELFQWRDTPGKQCDLLFGSRPVLRYMYAALDESAAEKRSATFKPYHHLFDPTGEILLTKGVGGLFPHHRGLFYGFNRISYEDGKKKADTWHCNNGEYQSHLKFVSQEAGCVLGRQVAEIQWHGQDKAVFATELRELTAYGTPAGTMIEFASRLESAVGKVRLDGDPQHAGFQFRATQEVPDKTSKETYYLRPDGKGEPGKFRNWDAQTRDPRTVNLPWNALSFVAGGKRFTCCYLDRPENPKESRFSERDYGRFGSYFEYDLDKGRPLDLNYRIWLQAGEMSVEEVRLLATAFIHPPRVK